MTDFDTTTHLTDDELKDVPFESVPQLANDEDFIRKADRLRELKQLEALFDDKKDDNGLPRGEYGRLKIELGARAMAAGVKSVAYIDLRIQNVEGGVTKGKVTGSAIMDAASGVLSVEQLRSIVLAAKDLDEDLLLKYGIPAHVINAGRTKGKPRAASTRVEWIGAKGKGGAGKAAGSGETVQ